MCCLLRRVGKLQTHEPHVCAREDQGTDSPRSHVKTHAIKGDDLTQPTLLQQGQILSDPPGVLLWCSDSIIRQRKSK